RSGRGSLREARTIVRILYRFAVSPLRHLRQQSEVQAFDGLAAFKGQFRPYPSLILKAGDFMTSCAAEVADPLLPFFFQLGIVHESSIGIGTGLLLLQGDEVGGDVGCILL